MMRLEPRTTYQRWDKLVDKYLEWIELNEDQKDLPTNACSKPFPKEE
jgi:hypothetical protein